ncbi:protein kinase domain-containing protein [Ditylenchus destructor]|uniref:non-specific serine/threonine protein kinase n=1 Tax=Ditylenchus destructor TaxID=166010 RepID=A0AAD4N276_9BILA|nr:protein kinase domain-containing protein [Ditylenchus destructor]
MGSRQHIEHVTELIKTVKNDRRDEWPDVSKSYIKGENLSSGHFGAIRFAECRDPVFGFHGLDVRQCVVKTVYLERKFDAGKSDTENENSIALRELFMDLYILNRCRHEHVMHSHAVFISDSDLNIVFPRCYSLNILIEGYRQRKKSEPISVLVIAKIIRQLCLGLDYLQRIGIVHRDVEPENIYLTRKGTVKLGHFGQAFPLVDDRDKPERCKSPVGKEEFMCYEKLFNLYKTTSVEDELEYGFASDIWSLGVLILRMVSYFPDEKGQKLPNDFALTMGERKMPFHYFIVEMMQLRSRLVQSGGEKLKKFVSEKLLTAKPEKRATAVALLETPEMKSWCLAHVDEDKVFIRSKLINEVDFANRLKLEEDAPNYNCLESKDIPAEFYWDDTWKDLENTEFCVKLSYSNGSHLPQEYRFKFGSPEPLFKILYKQYMKGCINLFDILLLDYEIKELIYKLMAARSEKLKESGKIDSLNKSIFLKNSQLNSTSEVIVQIRERWRMSTQLLPLTFAVFFTSFFGIVVTQSSLINPQARLCSFTDDSTGYSVFWHTNCTGYSLELVLVEVVNGFVNVQPAKLYPGQPPQKNFAAPYLVAPRGAFFGASLEATFSIHESLLTGCKEWTFYSAPTRIGAPYGGQPYSKQVCNVAETCSRNNCVRGQLPYDAIYNYGNSPYFRPEQNFPGSSAFQQPIVTPALQRNDQLYGSNNVYGSQPMYDQYGQYNTLRQPAQMGYAQGPYTGLSGQYQNQFMTQQRPFYNQQQQYGFDPTRQRAPTLTQIFSQYDAASNTNQRLYNGYMLPAREYPWNQNSANGFRSSLKGTAYEGQDDQFVRTTPYFDSPYQPTYLNNNPATVSTYNSPQVKYYNDGRGNYGLPSLDNTPWRFFDPGMNNTPMYYPYRTAVFDNTQMSQNYGRTNLRMNDANFRLTDSIKCDKGTDPSWCADYVREFVHWQQRYEGKTPQGICNSLRDSLRNSDHQCCNILKNIQC